MVDDIRHAGGTAEALAADLADEAAASALVPACVDALGPPTLLVNSASAFENDRLATVTRDSWDDHLDVNLRAPLVLIQRFAETLPHGAEGNVVNMLDQLVWNPGVGFLSYTISKVGLWIRSGPCYVPPRNPRQSGCRNACGTATNRAR